MRELADSFETEVLLLEADISKPNEVEEAVREIDSRWGRLDIVVVNAGINGTWAPVEELSWEEWTSTIDVNLNGSFLTVKHCVPLLKRAGGAICHYRFD